MNSESLLDVFYAQSKIFWPKCRVKLGWILPRIRV